MPLLTGILGWEAAAGTVVLVIAIGFCAYKLITGQWSWDYFTGKGA
jgi:hypothetical protein